MQSSVRVVVSLVLLTSVFASYHSRTKQRRHGDLNLYPFPRVGRASRNTWQVPLNDFFLDYEPVEKRQLYAFPRVGRGELTEVQPGPLPVFKLAPARRSGDDPGMWFGPRLGRSYKSEHEDITMQKENNDLSEPEQMEPVHEYRKKREIHSNRH